MSNDPVPDCTVPNIKTVRPSCETEVANWVPAPLEICCAVPVPSAACVNSFGVPPSRVEDQMMRFPSGIQIGVELSDGPRLTAVNVCRLRSHIQIPMPS